MPLKVISQAVFFYKLQCILIYLLFSANEHSLLLYVGEGRLLILISGNALVGGTLFDFQNFPWNLLLEMWWQKLPRDKALWYRQQLNIIFVGFLVSYWALQFLSRRKYLKLLLPIGTVQSVLTATCQEHNPWKYWLWSSLGFILQMSVMKKRDLFVLFNFVKNYGISILFRKLKIKKNWFCLLFSRNQKQFYHIYSFQ